MNKNTLQDDWKQLRSAVRQRWGALTDNDLDTVDEKPDQLPGLLQARYGDTREQAEDVALASKKHRIAMKGGLNFINDRFVDVTVAVLDKRGCAVYSQKVHGPFRQPQIEKVSIFKSIAGSVLNALEDAWKFIQGEECTVFYSGSVAQPEG